MTPERYEKLKATLARRQPDLTLLTEQVHKPRNVAALVRSADAVGIHEVHMVWPYDQHRAYSGTAMGSDRWVNVVRHPSMSEGIVDLKSKGFKVYAAHASETSLSYRKVDYTVPCAILMGNEKKGVPREVLSQVDEQIEIPMVGMVESFNVSVAASIILVEAQRQRDEAGLYERCRIDEQELTDTFFRWAHPQIAKYCHQKGLAYPPVSEVDGEIIDPSAWYESVRAGQAEFREWSANGSA